MRRILCFGDSNTWGYDPATEDRFDETTRWTGVLKAALGDDFTVIEEGLNGRTTVWNDPIEGYKNGHDYLVPCLETHRPLDLVVLMLGTNDLKRRFSLSAYDISQGVAVLLRAISYSKAGRAGHPPRVLLMAPPPVARLSNFAEMFEGAEAKSLLLGQHYRTVATEYNVALLDTASVIRSSDIDGIHFEADEHAKLGRAVAHEVLALVGDW
jgi:lysophospholipase L1-like esterase